MRLYLLILLSFFIATPVWACKCAAPNNALAKISYDKADIVIKAHAVYTSDGWDDTGPLLKIRVDEVIKGHNIPDEITANYNDHTAACGNYFEQGTDYIIALYDTRSLILTDNNSRGYGFRVMISCEQYQVRHYINHIQSKIKESQ